MIYIINPKDNVAVALQPIKKLETVGIDSLTITAQEDIPRGHKIALKKILKGESVIKYGNIIGVAKVDIPEGGWIHTHNLLSHGDEHHGYEYQPVDEKIFPGNAAGTFMGYQRKNGVGTRNYIALISGSFCTNTHMTAFAKMAAEKYPKTESFDGFLPLTHDCGCGQMGQDLLYTRMIVASLMQNPNFGGVLFVELGCENNLFETIRPYVTDLDESRFRKIHMQSEENEYDAAMIALGDLYDRVNKDKRQPCLISSLHLAENCGGSVARHDF